MRRINVIMIIRAVWKVTFFIGVHFVSPKKNSLQLVSIPTYNSDKVFCHEL